MAELAGRATLPAASFEDVSQSWKAFAAALSSSTAGPRETTGTGEEEDSTANALLGSKRKRVPFVNEDLTDVEDEGTVSRHTKVKRSRPLLGPRRVSKSSQSNLRNSVNGHVASVHRVGSPHGYVAIGSVDLKIELPEHIAALLRSHLPPLTTRPVYVRFSHEERYGPSLDSDHIALNIHACDPGPSRNDLSSQNGPSRSEPTCVTVSMHNESERTAEILRHIVRLQEGNISGFIRQEDAAKGQSFLSLNADGSHGAHLRLDLLWKVSSADESYKGEKPIRSSQQFWPACLPELFHQPAQHSDSEIKTIGLSAQEKFLEPQTFYETVYTPPPEQDVPKSTQSPLVNCKLYPYQRRSVAWLLAREGVEYRDNKLAATKRPDVCSEPPAGFRKYSTQRYGVFYASYALAIILVDTDHLHEFRIPTNGGILAEEMGLGKTVEIISLIAQHRREISSSSVLDSDSGTLLTPSKATLIVTPRHLLEQWQNELTKHCPALTFFTYEGLSSKLRVRKSEAIVEELTSYDVVLTTYPVLAREIHYAQPLPDRQLRHKRDPPQRSPLVKISWWRTCLDEAQMVENGVTKAAQVARMIPRVHAWAVTGTPVKKRLDDLRGLLLFLGYSHLHKPSAWSRMNAVTFASIFGTIALRHNKSQIRHELRLPAQKRLILTIPFRAIEEQNYFEVVAAMCKDCGLNPDGSLRDADSDFDDWKLKAKMRSWLRRLRETCLHPRTGESKNRTMWTHDPLKTVSQVLEVMMVQNETALRSEERQLVSDMIEHGHVLIYAGDNPNRQLDALKVYLPAMKMVDKLVAECRSAVAAELQKIAERKELDAGSGNDSADGDGDGDGVEASKSTSWLVVLRRGLTQALMVQHVCLFFVATAYFQYKDDEKLVKKDSDEYKKMSDLEATYYDKAKEVRNELLSGPRRTADDAIKSIHTREVRKKWISIPLMPEVEHRGGIENRKVLLQLDAVCKRLRQQAKYIQSWRNEIVKHLRTPLVDEDKDQEITGEEYEDSTKAQDQLFVYITMLRIIVADRSFALTGQRNLRTEEDAKEAKSKAVKGESHAPELFIDLLDKRQDTKSDPKEISIRGIMGQLRGLATDLEWRSQKSTDRAAVEFGIVERQLKQVQAMSAEQLKTVVELEKEVDLFHNVMNHRIEFYRQLQVISDQVQPYRETLCKTKDEVALQRIASRAAKRVQNINQMRTKARFFLHLRDEENSKDEGKICIICREPFENGILTVCGHVYCKECFLFWHAHHKTCPLCKRRITKEDFHEVTYKPQELHALQEQPNVPATSSQDSLASSTMNSTSIPSEAETNLASTTIYSSISTSMLNEIKSIELEGSYGSKIDTLVRHLLWLRDNDPGAKSIIFSQFGNFLRILSGALKHFGIGHTAFSTVGGIEKFRNDPALECFLLDAKSNSSGLNLVNATHIFLCEPLINTALELQAIARVHRIGQQRPTTVYMYLIRDTVEEAIYDISVSRRLQHMHQNQKERELNKNTVARSIDAKGKASASTSGQATPGLEAEVTLDDANSLELVHTSLADLMAKKEGGEVVHDNDLWNCLFRKRATDVTAADRELFQREVDREIRAQAAEGTLYDANVS